MIKVILIGNSSGIGRSRLIDFCIKKNIEIEIICTDKSVEEKPILPILESPKLELAVLEIPELEVPETHKNDSKKPFYLKFIKK